MTTKNATKKSYNEQYKLRKEEIDRLAEYLISLPLDQTIAPYVTISNKSKGHEVDALCPFHNDQNFGTFKINPRKQLIKCFGCDISFKNIISFVMKLRNVRRNSAVLLAALDNNIISYDEYTTLSGEKPITNYKPPELRKVENVPKRVTANEPASSEILNKIYKYFILGNELIGKSRLSETHYKYLKDRGLTDDEIKIGEFFSTPSPEIMDIIIKAVKKEGLELEILNQVPGFFQWKKNNKFDFNKVKGIYFPIRNYKGEIIGIHRRNDKASEKAGRYFWHSSSFTAYEEEKYYIGAKSDTPIDVLYPKTPKEQWKPYFIVVEGKFKEITLSKYCNCVILSVQGVGNHSDIGEVVKNIQEFTGIEFKAGFIAFDADMDSNEHIYKQAVSLTRTITELNKVDLYYYVWDSEKGKGIDDLIQNGHMNTIKSIDRTYLEKTYGTFLAECSAMVFDKDKGREVLVVNRKELRENFVNKILNKK